LVAGSAAFFVATRVTSPVSPARVAPFYAFRCYPPLVRNRFSLLKSSFDLCPISPPVVKIPARSFPLVNLVPNLDSSPFFPSRFHPVPFLCYPGLLFKPWRLLFPLFFQGDLAPFPQLADWTFDFFHVLFSGCFCPALLVPPLLAPPLLA